MVERAPDRLVRMLGLVAYLDRHPGVRIEELAAHFEVTPEQVLADINLLWMTGTPGYWPDDLLDFDAASLESGVVRLTAARGMSRALRLGPREAVSLVAALRALRDSVGDALAPEDRRVLESTYEVLVAATGEAAASVDVQLTVDGAPEVLAAAREAMTQDRLLRIRYVDAADRTTERTVEPWQVLTGDEHSYLVAWCQEAQGERYFRLDRVLAATVLDEPAEPGRRTGRHAERRAGRSADGVFQPTADHERVVLDLAGRARWVAEQVPVAEVQDLDDGGVRVTLQVASRAWLQALLLRIAQDVRRVDPPELGLDVAEQAERALSRYADG